jgi:hypothetical protein
MQTEKCPEYIRLQAEVETVLEKLTQLTSVQLNAFRSRDQAEFMRLDKELETTVGLKERTIGALKQHSKEHRCQPWAAASAAKS